MKNTDFQSAMAFYAEADERATVNLIEHIAALCLLKLDPPARGDDVVSVEISLDEITEMLIHHQVESRYEEGGGKVTVYLTPLNLPRDPS